MIEPKTLHDRRLQVMHVNGVFDNIETKLVRLPNDLASFDSATCQPHAIGIGVMIASRIFCVFGFANLHHWGSPELSSPHN